MWVSGGLHCFKKRNRPTKFGEALVQKLSADWAPCGGSVKPLRPRWPLTADERLADPS